MPTLVIAGSQWGDEGKGKIVHFLGNRADVVVRYQGGPNAGHTIILGDKPFVLHTLPSGIVLPGKICVISNGVVIDPEILRSEVCALNIPVKNRLLISESAHIILPYHRQMDERRERSKIRLGTTLRGIGPAYADKVVRIGVRVVDFLSPATFRKLLDINVREKKAWGQKRDILKKYQQWRRFLYPFAADTVLFLNRAIARGKKIIFESAQGTLLDLDFGTYPYVTSSNPVSGGVCTGAGVPPTAIDYILGVMKAYTTRVGDGPFPTEIRGSLAAQLREAGMEYGATTGRPRRCGWIDIVSIKHSIMVNGFNSLALTKLDCLQGIHPLKICVAYVHKGKRITRFPASREVISECKPVYIELPGFNKPLCITRGRSIMPRNANLYVKTLEKLLGIKISLLSSGRTREETFVLDKRVLNFGKYPA
ncbi:MAG: adenylosuccinate synthase [Elusimicrobia bacterium]|nr:adenylosuccinate synthase [Elusimicrobiota bacterium]